jgi:hypothetical protein
MGTYVSDPPRLRWPLVLMIAAAIASVILIAIVMGLPDIPASGQTHP